MGGGVEPQWLLPPRALFLGPLAPPAVRVRLGLPPLPPVAVRLAPAQRDRQAGGGHAPHRVEDVGRDAHTFSSLSSRSRVILRCSAAATRSSVVGSFPIRSCMAARISCAPRPLAEMRKTCPKRRSYSRFSPPRPASVLREARLTPACSRSEAAG